MVVTHVTLALKCINELGYMIYTACAYVCVSGYVCVLGLGCVVLNMYSTAYNHMLQRKGCNISDSSM